jgi:sucrose-6-phosphate hydrolase SacC (GH32 family)
VRELQELRTTQHKFREGSLEEANIWLKQRTFDNQLLEIEIDFGVEKNTSKFGLKVVTGPGEETVITCDPALAQLRLDRSRSGRTELHKQFPGTHAAPLRITADRVSLHLLLDTSSIEVFGNDGETVLTDLILPNAGRRKLEIFAANKPPRVKDLQIWELKSAWASQAER